MKMLALAAAVVAFAGAASAYPCGSATSAQTPIITAPTVGS
jgi:hypothetical protein